MADEAGCQPTSPGGVTLSCSYQLCRRAGRETRRPAVGLDERSVTRLRQEIRFHQRVEQLIAHVAIESPQTLGLRRRQAKTRHFSKLALDPLKHVVDAHGALRTAGSTVGVAWVVIATRVPTHFRGRVWEVRTA